MANIETLKADQFNFAEVAAPSTPSSGQMVVYGKTDGKLYVKNDGGTEYDLTAGSGGATVATVDATLGADVTMTNANTAYDGPSASFAAGTWLIVYKVSFAPNNNNTHDFTVKLWDGSTIYDEASIAQLTATTSTLALSCSGTAIVTLGSTTTLKLTAFDIRAGSTMKRDVQDNSGSSHTATRLVGYKVT